MRETKAVLVSIKLNLRMAAIFCIDQAHTENKVEHHSGIKGHETGENEYKKYCSNRGEGFYLVEKVIVGCDCTLLNGGR